PRLLPQAGGQARPLVAGVAGTGALLVLGGAMLFVSASVQAHRAAAATTFLHHYACLFHDFQWIWREDEPYPYPAGTPLAPNAAELQRHGARPPAEEAAFQLALQGEYDKWVREYLAQRQHQK